MRSKRVAWVGASAVWAAAAFGGIGLLMAAAHTPDTPADTQSLRPAEFAATPGRPSLVVCLHPRCPCSDATLDALAGLLAAAPGTAADVLFAVPEPVPPAWRETALVRRASATPGVRVRLDPGGRACAALGARSSGQAFLFDAAGRPVFSGGLTPGRGEAGDSAGAAIVRAALAGGPLPASALRADVFGCALYRPLTPEAPR